MQSCWFIGRKDTGLTLIFVVDTSSWDAYVRDLSKSVTCKQPNCLTRTREQIVFQHSIETRRERAGDQNMAEVLNVEQIRTVHLVPLTPWDSAGRLNRDSLAEHISRMYAAGMRVFLPAAGTSEYQNLSADEIVDCVRVTREASGPDAAIFAPVGMQIGHAIDVAARSMDAGATGLLFMPFCHPYLSDAGARDYYNTVLEQVPAPSMFYKKGPLPSDELLLEMADHPHAIGVKYAVNDMHAFRKVVLADGGRIEWLCGSAERFAPFYMLAGSGGYTTGAGNLCPHLTLAMHAAFTAGAYQEGLRLQQIILPIEDYRAREGDSYNISMLKFAMTLLGQNFGQARAPQRQLTAGERSEITAMMNPILAAESELQHELTSVGLSNG